MTPILQLSALSVEFRVPSRHGPSTLRALRGVDLSVARGETVALVGESGSGKSTLGRAALRLLDSASGRIWLEGVDVTNLTRAELRSMRRRAQLIFQDPYASLDPRMTVGQQLAEAIWIHRLARRADLPRRVGELLEQVGLGTEVRHRFPNALSGGQRQRVGIARALAVDPELLVLDEPVSALDVSVQAQILNLLMDLQRQRGLSYLFITHDLRIVHRLADRVAVLYLGRIVEEAPTAELFGAPRHPYTRLLLGSLAEIRPQPGRPDPARAAGRGGIGGAQGEARAPHGPPIQIDPPSPFEPPSGCAFHPRCPLALDRCRAELPQLVALGNAGARVACFAAERDEPAAHLPAV